MPRTDRGGGAKGAGGYPHGGAGSLNVPCPKCGARKGMRCHALRPNTENYWRRETHQDRRDAWNALRRGREEKQVADKEVREACPFGPCDANVLIHVTPPGPAGVRPPPPGVKGRYAKHTTSPDSSFGMCPASWMYWPLPYEERRRLDDEAARYARWKASEQERPERAPSAGIPEHPLTPKPRESMWLPPGEVQRRREEEWRKRNGERS